MEKLLILGINTRAIVNSALKLNYNTLSGSYFSTIDSQKPYKEKHILKQTPKKSCQYFENNYNHKKLLEISKEMIEETDHIILTTGISPTEFKGKYKKYKKKIIGNQNTNKIENKYKFYKKIKNKFPTPKTFKSDIPDAIEIAKQHNNKEFIIKPLQGSGGYGVKHLNYNKNNNFKPNNLTNKNTNPKNSKYLIQEFIHGHNISSSVLRTKNETKTIINSKILTETNFGIKNSFKYCGNIAPLNTNVLTKYNTPNKKYNNFNKKTINNISEELINNFKLIGSNGVDMIINNNNTYIIEINPRFQGTYEIAENVLNINLLESHIKACNNELINIPQPKGYSIKKIIYSKEKSIIGNLNIKNVHDIPYKGVIIEKKQPIATIITHENQLNNTIKKLQTTTQKIKKRITPIKKNINET